MGEFVDNEFNKWLFAVFIIIVFLKVRQSMQILDLPGDLYPAIWECLGWDLLEWQKQWCRLCKRARFGFPDRSAQRLSWPQHLTLKKFPPIRVLMEWGRVRLPIRTLNLSPGLTLIPYQWTLLMRLAKSFLCLSELKCDSKGRLPDGLPLRQLRIEQTWNATFVQPALPTIERLALSSLSAENKHAALLLPSTVNVLTLDAVTHSEIEAPGLKCLHCRNQRVSQNSIQVSNLECLRLVKSNLRGLPGVLLKNPLLRRLTIMGGEACPSSLICPPALEELILVGVTGLEYLHLRNSTKIQRVVLMNCPDLRRGISQLPLALTSLVIRHCPALTDGSAVMRLQKLQSLILENVSAKTGFYYPQIQEAKFTNVRGWLMGRFTTATGGLLYPDEVSPGLLRRRRPMPVTPTKTRTSRKKRTRRLLSPSLTPVDLQLKRQRRTNQPDPSAV